MPGDQHDFQDLIERAHAGEQDAVGQLLELYRQYLRTIARRKLGSMLNPRLDVSDVVQQTMINAHEHFQGFAGNENAELQAWLRCILQCNISTAIRDHLYTKKRAMSLETSLEPSDPSHHGNGAKTPVSSSPSPSLQASQIEESLRLLDQLDRLPEDQATAVKLRYLECRSITEVADHLGRSVTAAAGLVKRGMQNLRKQMK